MALTALEELFAIDTIQGVVDAPIAEEKEEDWNALRLFREFADELEVDGDTVKWDRRTHTRTLPPATGPDSPSIRFSEGGAGQQHTPVAWFQIHKVIKTRNLLTRERDLGSLRPNAEAKMRRTVMGIKKALLRAANFFCTRVLTPNGVQVNPTNFPGSDTSYNYLYSAIAANAIAAAQSVTDPATRFLSGTWTGSLHDLQETYSERVGYELRTWIARRKFYTAIRGNTQLTDWAGQSALAEGFLRAGRIRDALRELGGIDNWLQWDEFFQTETGSVDPTKTPVHFMPSEDDAIALPALEDLDGVLGWAEADVDVPQEAIGFEESAVVRMAGLKTGMSIYAIWPGEPDPPAIKVIGRWGFLPVVTNEDAVQYVSGIASGISS